MFSNNIPKVINFIWAGGSFLMQPKSIENMVKWKIKNPDYKIKLWVDDKTSGKDLSELKEYYTTEFMKAYNKLGEASISNDEVCSFFYIENIRSTPEICQNDDPLIDYELARIDPNYGASSDILRYRILYNYGGMYADHDVIPGKDLLQVFVKESNSDNSEHVLYVDHLSQMIDEKIDDESLKAFSQNWDRIANDVFICTPKNPLILAIIKTVEEKNYRLLKNNNQKEAIKLVYRNYDIKNNTIERTGPDVIRKVITDNSLGPIKIGLRSIDECIKAVVTDGDEIVNVILKPIKSLTYRLAQPLVTIKPKTKFKAPNVGSWLNVGLDFHIYDDPEKIFMSLLSTVLFEQNYFGILRLEDHLTIVKETAKHFSLKESELCNEFLEKIRPIIKPKKLMVVQWTNPNSVSKMFYDQNHILDKTCFTLPIGKDNSYLKDILKWALSEDFFSGDANKLYAIDKINENWWVLAFDESYPNQEIVRIFHRIESGCQFLDLLFRNKEIVCFEMPLLEKEFELENSLKKYQLILSQAKEIFIFKGIPQSSINQLQKEIHALLKQHTIYMDAKKEFDVLGKKASEEFQKKEQAKEQYQAAFKLYQTACTIAEAKLGLNSLYVATAYYNMGSCLARQGDIEKAIEYTEKCYELRKKRLPEGNTQIRKAFEKINQLRASRPSTSPSSSCSS